WVLALYVPRIFQVPAAWLGTFETFAIFGGTWLLAATLPIDGKARVWDPIVQRGQVFGRICFGVSLPVFGISHFVYHDFVATWVPAWMGFPQFWAYFTGAAHIAAGVAIVTNMWPRVAAATHDAFEWNGIFVASALCASAVLVAGTPSSRLVVGVTQPAQEAS